MEKLLVTDKIQETFKRHFDDLVKLDHPLNGYCTFGTGGKARVFAEVGSARQIADLVKVAGETGVNVFMLGGGSNLLISDQGYDGLIIRNTIKGLEIQGEGILSGAGEDLQSMVDFAAESGLSGLEFATGIYGTVGGAIFGNAGAYGSETGGLLEWAELVDRQGSIRIEKSRLLRVLLPVVKIKDHGRIHYESQICTKNGQKRSDSHQDA